MSTTTVLQSPKNHLLYCGDGTYGAAAAILSAVILEAGFSLTHLSSDEPLPELIDLSQFSTVILSDYPAHRLSPSMQNNLIAWTRNGGRLIMCGGFLSFTGKNAGYNSSVLADILPVTFTPSDDRCAHPQGVIVRSTDESPFAQLDWTTPPSIVGFNRLKPTNSAQVILEGLPLLIHNDPAGLFIAYDSPIPLCILQTVGRGQSIALAFDPAPHWIGGMIDWGTGSIELTKADRPVEMGNYYRQFLEILISITSDKEPS